MIHVTFHSISDKAVQHQIAGIVDLVLQQDGYLQLAIDARETERVTLQYQKEVGQCGST